MAVARACDKAFPPPADLTPPDTATEKEKAEALAELKAWRKAHRFHPHQVRHAKATEMRKTYGLEKTRAVLGHSSPRQAEVYAELDEQTTVDVMMGGGVG